MSRLATYTLTNRKQPQARALTITGGVVADYKLGTQGVARSAGVEGDGQAVGSHAGVGIWPAATNRCINGNAATNITGITDTSCTTTRVASGVVQFGTTAFEVVSSNLAANEGPSQAINGGAASTQYTVSAWAWLISGAATVRAALNDSVAGKQGGTAVTLTTTPQRITVTATTGAASANWAGHIETTVQQVGTWRIGGWQIEAGPIATPYIHTDGATATRPAGRIQVPSTGMSATAGAVVTRVVRDTSVLNYNMLLSWTDGSHRYELYEEFATFWTGISQAGGATDQANSLSYPAISAGAPGTSIFAWTVSAIKTAGQGGGFATTVRAGGVPTLATSIDVGSRAATLPRNGRVYWIAFYGPGGQFLSDADSAHIGRLGAIIDPLTDLPRSDDLVVFWDGVSDYYLSYV